MHQYFSNHSTTRSDVGIVAVELRRVWSDQCGVHMVAGIVVVIDSTSAPRHHEARKHQGYQQEPSSGWLDVDVVSYPKY